MTAIVSFSLTMGITPISSNPRNVFCAFKYCVLYRTLAMLRVTGVSTHIGDIVSGKKYLSNGLSRLAEKHIPQAHELALTYSSKCLST